MFLAKIMSNLMDWKKEEILYLLEYVLSNEVGKLQYDILSYILKVMNVIAEMLIMKIIMLKQEVMFHQCKQQYSFCKSYNDSRSLYGL